MGMLLAWWLLALKPLSPLVVVLSLSATPDMFSQLNSQWPFFPCIERRWGSNPFSDTLHLQNPKFVAHWYDAMRSMQLSAITVKSHEVQPFSKSFSSKECQTIFCNCLFLQFQDGWRYNPHKDFLLVNVTWNYAHFSESGVISSGFPETLSDNQWHHFWLSTNNALSSQLLCFSSVLSLNKIFLLNTL